jgi:phage shock protein C
VSPLAIGRRRAQARGMTTTSAPARVRPREGRIVAGVCAGLARRFGWNVTVVRLIALLSFVLPGSQLLIYAICWIVIPAEGAPGRWLGSEAPRADAAPPQS